MHEPDTTVALVDAALSYAALGWPVIPLHSWTGDRCSCGRADCGSPAKHPRTPNGLHDASTDPEQIAAWWRRWPTANVGLRTGVAFDVLDIDGAEGEASIDAHLADTDVDLAGTPWTATGGGGSHYLYQPTGSGNRAGLLDKVDWRGSGGYIVAPPSLHASGRRYEWMLPPSTPLAFVPDPVRDLVVPPQREGSSSGQARALPAGSGDGTAYGIGALDAELSELRRAAPGTRNHTLNQVAFNLYQLVAGGELDDGAVSSRLEETALAIGLGEHETMQTIGSARRAGMASPRNAPPSRVSSNGATPATSKAKTPAWSERAAHLPEAFWSARPIFEQIRQAARNRLIAPDAVLGAVLVRVAASTNHAVEIPAIVGTAVGLTTFVAIVGTPEAGKSSAPAVASELVPTPDGVLDKLPIGSGEGMVEILFDLVDEEGDDGKRRKVKRQVKHAAIFHIDEGAVLSELANRQGSTLLPTLRTAYSHGTLGNANASAERRRILDGRSYVYGITMGIQPEKAAPLLDDTAAGTPQRFVWLNATDPDAPAQRPEWPGPLDWQPPDHGELIAHAVMRGGYRRYPLVIHPEIVDEVVTHRRGILTGTIEVDASEAHQMLVRLKVAALLALLDQRLALELDDWQLAQTVVATSRRVRSAVEGTIAVVAQQRERAADERHARRELHIESSKETKALASAARSIANIVQKHHTTSEHVLPDGCAHRCLARAIAGKHRTLVTVDDAIAEAERLQWIQLVDGRWTPGDSKPA